MLVAIVGPAAARGQFTQGTPTTLPAPVIPNQPVSQLTPDQLRNIMYLRALQSRGRRGVRTGYPQFVPFGNMGYGGDFGMMPQQAVQPDATDPQTTTKSSAKKRAELRAEREEKNRVAREEAKKKREQAAQARAEAKAKAAATAKAKANKQPPANP
jgi:hypothetical protein